jgi:D-3-phosphoglycerate dehydrogenase
MRPGFTYNQAVRILVAEKTSFSVKGLQALAEIGKLAAFDVPQAELASAVQEYDILVVRLGLRVDAAVLEAGARLLGVGTPTTGLDHIDLQTASRRGIPIWSLKGERGFLDQEFATAEHTFALLLSLVRRIPSAFASVLEGEWRRDLYRGSELNGKTLGILGCGRLGTMVARYGLGFGMQVLAHDPYLAAFPPGVEPVSSLDELLARSDVFSIHVPLNDETRGMIAAPQFARLHPGALLVNTARGAVVAEDALLQALASGLLAGAALDVLEDEHLLAAQPERPLIAWARTHDNVILTPHIGGATFESVEKADLFLAGKIRSFLANHLNS